MVQDLKARQETAGRNSHERLPLEFLGEVTSTIRDIPSEVVLTKADVMPRDCAVNLDHIQTVAQGRIGPVITTLSLRKMVELRAAGLFALGF